MSSPDAVIFHHPLPIEADPTVGSTTHVTRMMQGLEAAGFELEVVAGYSRERLRAMERVRADLAKGRVFRFAYAEASTAPTSLNDPRHVPTHPLADYWFFRALRRHGLPIGLFYPDVHWRYPFYRSAVPSVKRRLAEAFYRYDLRWYRDVVDVLFMPSSRMRLAVPGWETSDRVVGLAPGGQVEPMPLNGRPGELHLFYVGSISPPLYDIGDLITAVREVPEVRLTISCPASETNLATAIRDDRITVVHEHGDALVDRYRACDVACLVYTPEPYRVFAMPVKLFEAIGYGRPLLANPGTSAANFIASANVGWVVDPADLTGMLRRLAADSTLVRSAYESVLAQQSLHSWESRARFVAASLTEPVGSRPTCPTESP